MTTTPDPSSTDAHAWVCIPCSKRVRRDPGDNAMRGCPKCGDWMQRTTTRVPIWKGTFEYEVIEATRKIVQEKYDRDEIDICLTETFDILWAAQEAKGCMLAPIAHSLSPAEVQQKALEIIREHAPHLLPAAPATSPPIQRGPIQKGFEYEVRLAVSIPLAWAKLLKEASAHHYDMRCNEAGDHGVINGLFNTACDSDWPSTYPVSWSDLDLITKVAEQLEYHTRDHELIRAIRAWLRVTMDAIEAQRQLCCKLPDPPAKEDA